MDKNPISEKTAAAYIRVSTDEQTELSPDAQKRLILEYAKKNRMFISGNSIFTENGISGKKADKRPEFQRMISMAKDPSHPYDVILVWKFSRFARNQEESIVYKSMLRKDSVEVISVSEPLIEGPFGTLIERIIEWMDEYYSIRLSGEVTRGMTEKALRGGYQATTPLGYRYHGSGKPPTILNDEAFIVQSIYRMYLQGTDPTGIARILNQEGYRTKKGNSYDNRGIRYILKNPFYIGKVRWNRAPHSCGKDNPECEIIISDASHAPIIDADIFEEVQRRLQFEHTPAKARAVSTCTHWLTGILKCPICGANLSYHGSGGNSFQCWRYAKGYHPGSSAISAPKVTSALLRSIDERLSSQTIHYTYEPQKLQKIPSHTLSVRDELKRLSFKESRIREAYESGVDTLEEYREHKRLINDERQKRLAALDNQANDREHPKDGMGDVLKTIDTVQSLIKNPDVSYTIKGNAVRCILSKIIYDKEHNEFHFYYSV